MFSVWIPLTQNKVVIIDSEDAARVNAFKWYAHESRGKFYAARQVPREHGGQKRVFLHKWLIGASDAVLVDHINGDSLDCRRKNLRECTQAENVRNVAVRCDSVSGLKGVRFNEGTQRWHAKIQVNHVVESLGYYATAETAARAYDARAREAFGEFARLNYPKESAQPFIKPLVVRNRSGYHGVAWNASGNKYVAYIQHDGKRVHLGSFADPERAARVRDARVKELGLRLRLNFPDVE